MANNGDQGIRLTQAEEPDLILMDMSLPVLDGWEVTRPGHIGIPEPAH